MDWTRYKQLQIDEEEVRKTNPLTVEITAQDWREIKFAVMLLRRVRDNTKDLDLDRVLNHLEPTVQKIADGWREIPEIRRLINEQREMLGLGPLGLGQDPD